MQPDEQKGGPRVEQTFGERLQILRKRRGMTQGDLAAALGVSVQTVVRYEGLRLEEVKPGRLAAIARALDVNPRELTGEPPESEEDIRLLTRGLRNMEPLQRESLIRMMMPLVEKYQIRGGEET